MSLLLLFQSPSGPIVVTWGRLMDEAMAQADFTVEAFSAATFSNEAIVQVTGFTAEDVEPM
jgi:hypothetical protein